MMDGRKARRGLSAVIGMMFVLLILLVVLIPLMTYVTASPTAQEQAMQMAEPYLQQAKQQMSEVNQQDSPVHVYYYEGDVYVVYSSTPPVPINVSYFLLYNGGDVTTKQAPQPTKTTFNGDPAYAYPVGNGYSLVGLVTTMGNIIYADPYTPPTQTNNGDTAGSLGGVMPPLPLAVNLGSNMTPGQIKFSFNQNPLEPEGTCNPFMAERGLLFTFTGNDWVNLSVQLVDLIGGDPTPSAIYLLLPTRGQPWPVIIAFNYVSGYWSSQYQRWVPGSWYMLIWTPNQGGYGMFDVVKVPSICPPWDIWPHALPLKLSFHITQSGLTLYAYYQQNGQWMPLPLPDQQLPQSLWNKIQNAQWGPGLGQPDALNYIGAIDTNDPMALQVFNVSWYGYVNGIPEWNTTYWLDGYKGGTVNYEWMPIYWGWGGWTEVPVYMGFMTIPGYNLTTGGTPIGVYTGPGYPVLPGSIQLTSDDSEIMVAWGDIDVIQYSVS